MSRNSIVISLLLVMIVVLYGVKIYCENQFSNKGIELAETLRELQAIKTEKVNLYVKILENESYTGINNKARNEQGFTDAEYYRI